MHFFIDNKVGLTADLTCTIAEQQWAAYSERTGVVSDEAKQAFLQAGSSVANALTCVINDVLDGQYRSVAPMSAMESTKERVSQGAGAPWICQQRDGMTVIG